MKLYILLFFIQVNFLYLHGSSKKNFLKTNRIDESGEAEITAQVEAYFESAEYKRQRQDSLQWVCYVREVDARNMLKQDLRSSMEKKIRMRQTATLKLENNRVNYIPSSSNDKTLDIAELFDKLCK